MGSSSDKRAPSSEHLGKQWQALAKVAMKQTCGDSPHLGDQHRERLFYREEARNTSEWSFGLHDVIQSTGIGVGATGEVPERNLRDKQDVAATGMSCCLDLPF